MQKIRIYGASDDLVEVEGATCDWEPEGSIGGEIGCYGSSADSPVELMLVNADGGFELQIDVWYGHRGFWQQSVSMIEGEEEGHWPEGVEVNVAQQLPRKCSTETIILSKNPLTVKRLDEG